MLSFRTALTFMLGAVSSIALSADAPPAASPKPQQHTRAVMTGDQVVRILDETVDWYRTLGVQQQSATQPSDLLIVYANRQTADRVMSLAFDIARANAELLNSEADLTTDTADSAFTTQARSDLRRQLDAQRAKLQEQIAQLRKQAAVSKAQRAELEAKASGLQSELDMVNARRNLLDTMAQFVSQSDENGTGASALKAHIDAIAASIPATTGIPSASQATNAAAGREQGSLLAQVDDGAGSSLGIWDLSSNVLKLSAKSRMIDAVDEKTAELQEMFAQIRARPLEQLKTFAARGDSLTYQAERASGQDLQGVRNQFDTLAWLFQQTADILVPLSKEGVLLAQYRHNLSNWRDAVDTQYRDALKTLGTRLGFLILLLLAVWVLAELWRRAVLRYVQEVRRRNQLLLVRKIVLWALVIAIVGFSFATELGSLVTFVGLITAGLAVAMQSVLVSFVGYFFLIGKYGIRVGDRVQIGSVTGEVIELGLVRLHLMELDQGLLGPTGRVVAFANSVVFQSSGGVFKQIPGVNLAWHEIAFTLPAGANPEVMKERMLAAVNHVLNDYREDIDRQTSQIQKTTASSSAGEALAQVQLRFSAAGVDAVARYPVQLAHAAEIDERVSRELMRVTASGTDHPALPATPA